MRQPVSKSWLDARPGIDAALARVAAEFPTMTSDSHSTSP